MATPEQGEPEGEFQSSWQEGIHVGRGVRWWTAQTGYEALELSACLLNDAVLAMEDDGHARKIFNFGIAHNQAVYIEACLHVSMT